MVQDPWSWTAGQALYPSASAGRDYLLALVIPPSKHMHFYHGSSHAKNRLLLGAYLSELSHNHLNQSLTTSILYIANMFPSLENHYACCRSSVTNS